MYVCVASYVLPVSSTNTTQTVLLKREIYNSMVLYKDIGICDNFLAPSFNTLNKQSHFFQKGEKNTLKSVTLFSSLGLELDGDGVCGLRRDLRLRRVRRAVHDQLVRHHVLPELVVHHARVLAGVGLRHASDLEREGRSRGYREAAKLFNYSSMSLETSNILFSLIYL